MSRENMRQKEKLAMRMLKRGEPAVTVARDKRIQVHRTTVQRWARKNGISVVPRNRHEQRDDLVDKGKILRLRKQFSVVNGKRKPSFTLKEIAGLCGCSSSYVKKVCARARKEGKL